MKSLRKSKILIILVSILIIIVSCGIFYKYEYSDKYKSDEISELIINKLSDESTENILNTWNFTDKHDISTFINAFNSKKRLIGKIDISPPEYSIIIRLKDNRRLNYNLWIGDATRGLVMTDNKVWELSKSSTNTIRKILN